MSTIQDLQTMLSSDNAAISVEVNGIQLDVPISIFEGTESEITSWSRISAWMARLGFMYSRAKKELSIRKAEAEAAMGETIAKLVLAGAKNEWSCKAEHRAGPLFMEKAKAVADAEETLALIEKLFDALKEKNGELKGRLYKAGDVRSVAAGIGRDEMEPIDPLRRGPTPDENNGEVEEGFSVEEQA